MEICNKSVLLDDKGRLNQAGTAKRMQFIYNRDQVRSWPFRLKEWDFYQFTDGRYVMQLTLGHVSYIFSATVVVFDLVTGQKDQLGVMRLFYVPKLELDPEGTSQCAYANDDFALSFKVTPTKRILSFQGQSEKYHRFEIQLDIANDPANEKMVIATPFKKKTHFYLNYKENYYDAEGYVHINDQTINLKQATGLLDWGRGVWPYAHQWFWGSASSSIQEVPFGLNIGWGFGENKAATENMYFYNRKAYPVGVLLVERDPGDYMKPWRLHDENGRLELTFTPEYDNFTQTNFVIIKTKCHQIHGYFAGTMQTSAGPVSFDHVLGFIEHAINRW